MIGFRINTNKKYDAMTEKVKNTNRNRFVITSVVLGTFFLIMLGIGVAILGSNEAPSINQEWKEILLLVLGAFLGSYSRIIDFWFNASDMDADGRADVSTPPPSLPSPCPECPEPDESEEENW